MPTAVTNNPTSPCLLQRMLRVVPLVSAIFLIGLTQLNAADKALLIGVGEYAKSRYNLDGIDLDVALMQETVSRLGYQNDNVRIIMDKEVTKENLLKQFSWLAKETKKTDRILVYYSGHGYQVADMDGDEADGFDEALTLYHVGVRPEALLSDDEINQLLRRIPSQNKIVLIDACCSGSSLKSIDSLAFPSNEVQVKSIGCPSADSGKTKNELQFAANESTGEDGVVYIGAAQDWQPALASPNGSFFTLALADIFKNGGQGLTPTDVVNAATEFIRKKVTPNNVYQPSLKARNGMENKAIFVTHSDIQPPPVVQNRYTSLADTGLHFNVGVPNTDYQYGDILQPMIDMPIDGYLNVIAVDAADQAVVLFPNNNEKENFYYKDKFILSGNFSLTAKPPSGEITLISIVTPNKLNMFELSHDRNLEGDALDIFIEPSIASHRGLGRKNHEGPGGNHPVFYVNTLKLKICADKPCF